MSTSSLASGASDGTSNISTGASQSSFSKDSMSFDRCPHCRVQYDFIKRVNNISSKIPLILNCKHTVCEDCIRKLCFSSVNACPVCSEKFVVPRNQIDNLPELFCPHYTLIGYLVWARNKTNKTNINWIPTGVTMKNKQVMGVDVINLNSEFEEKSEDESVDSETDRTNLSLEFDKCPEHTDNYLNIRCENCNDTICCYCFVEYHGGHTPAHLYKLNEQEMADLEQSKTLMELLLKQLHASQKKTKKLKTFGTPNTEEDVKGYFSDIHAKLHLLERSIRKKIVTEKRDEVDLEVVNATLRSGIRRVTQVLNFFNVIDMKQINVRALLKEIEDLKGIPCRLVSDCGTLEPTEFVSQNMFDDIEQNFMLKQSPGLEYTLIPIEDWTQTEEENHDSVPEKQTDDETPTVSDFQLEARPSVSSENKQTDSHLRKSNEGGKIKVIVTHLNNLNSFYVQKRSVQNSLKSMNSYIERKQKRRQLSAGDIIQGRMYAVKYEIKNVVRWRRGKLIDVIENSVQNLLYNVFFVDYGNTKCVTSDKLRELDYHIIKKEPYAFECKLTNPDNAVYDPNAHLRLSQIIGEKELYVHFVKKDADAVQEVDLLVSTSNGDTISVRDLLLKSPPVSEKEEMVLTKQFKLFKNSAKFSLGQEDQVVVSYIKDPFHICVQLASNVKIIEKMKQDMAKFYNHQRASSSVPVEGTDVVIKYDHPTQGEWHRGTITSVDMKNQGVYVYLVDWGGSANVPWSNIKLLTEQFTKIECQAIPVQLAHVQPQNVEERWSQEAVNFLKEQAMIENRFKMMVSNISPLEVALFQIRPSADICLNSLLVEHKYAVSTGNISETLYWPNEQNVEAENDDDDLSFQLIRKSEIIISENEDLELKKGLRQQVSVLHVESPDLIYIKFTKYNSIEEDLNKELQIHYSSHRKNKNTWKHLEHCVVYDSIKSRYFRGVIKSVAGPDAYIVYLYDHARELRVPQKLIFVQDSYFRRFLCHVCKCRLTKIKPAGDSRKWSKLAIELLQKIFKTYKIIHIKKTEFNTEEKLLGVIMWYSLATPAKALEPSKLNFISVNRVLIESGVGFSTANAPNCVYESPVLMEEEKIPNNISQAESNVDRNCKGSQDWYEMICEDEELITSSLTNWPKPMPLQKHTFDAVLTCVDSEGCFSIRDEDLQSIYLDMEENLNSKFNSLQLPLEDVQWRSSEMCTILYEDGWYRGSVIEILDTDEISVEMIDFGSEHVVTKNQLFKQIMFPDMPPLVNKIQLYDVYSKLGSWCASDVDHLLSIVSDNVKVVIKSKLDCEIPLAEVYLENGLSVNDLIIQKCSHLFRRVTKVTLGNTDYKEDENDLPTADGNFEDEENISNDSKEVQPNDITSSTVGYTYASIPEAFNKKVDMFILNIMKWGNEYNVVLNILNNRTSEDIEELITLNSEIQAFIDEQPALVDVEINEPCLSMHPRNNIWCRAVIYNVDSLEFGYVMVFFVDYGTVDMVSVDNLKTMRPEWFYLPVNNRIALINIELIQTARAEHVLMQLNNLRGKSAVVEIISEDPFKVHLFDGKNLCYQNFINCGIIRAL